MIYQNHKMVCFQERFLIETNPANTKNNAFTLRKTETEPIEESRSWLGKTYLNTKSTELQVITVKATLQKPINHSSIYIPPHEPISKTKII